MGRKPRHGSLCPKCAAPIVWAQRGAKWLPPLDVVGTALVVEHGQAVQRRVHVVHECQQVEQDLHMEYLRRLAESETARQSRYEAEKAQRRVKLDQVAERKRRAQQGIWEPGEAEDVYQAAMRYDCPRCPAKKGGRCLDLAELNRHKTRVWTLNPHLERWHLTEEWDEIQKAEQARAEERRARYFGIDPRT